MQYLPSSKVESKFNFAPTKKIYDFKLIVYQPP